MKKLFLMLLCFSLVLFQVLVFAQEKITVDQILNNYIKAIGGKEALEKIISRTATGTYEISPAGIKADLELYAKSPNSLLLKVKVSKSQIIQRAFNGKDGWAQELQGDIRTIEGTELELLKSKADFYKALHLKDLYPQLKFLEKKQIEITGKAKTEKKQVYVLESKKENSPTERFYFDVESSLLLRNDIDTEIPKAVKKEGSPLFESQKAVVPIEVYFEDYKEIDGVKIPLITRQSIDENNIIIRLNKVEHNKPIADSLFNQPEK